MRIKLRHRLTFAFDEPARNLIQVLRLMPRSHDGQRVSNWRIGVDPDCVLKSGEDESVMAAMFARMTLLETIPIERFGYRIDSLEIYYAEGFHGS